MDQATLVNAVNDMMRQIESENRTQIIKDEDGNNRTIIGREPDGHYVIAIVPKGKDVLTALSEYYKNE